MEKLVNKNTITSLELLEQINMFRKEEGNRAELRHDTLRDIIKDEFEEEVLSQNILEKSISSNGGRPIKIFELTTAQAKQVLVRESKFVRKKVIHYLEELENRLKIITYKPMSEAQKRNIEIRERYSKVKMVETLKGLIPLAKSETYKEILVAESVKILTGKELLPPVKMKEKSFSAKEIGDILGITPNKVGIIANKNGLKTENNGFWIHDKARHCNKEVPNFRYYEKAINEFKKYID